VVEEWCRTEATVLVPKLPRYSRQDLDLWDLPHFCHYLQKNRFPRDQPTRYLPISSQKRRFGHGRLTKRIIRTIIKRNNQSEHWQEFQMIRYRCFVICQSVARCLSIVTAATIAISLPQVSDACSRVCWITENHGVFSARSMDWGHSFDDVLFINPRGRKMNGGDIANNLEWTSRYGSVVASIYPFASTKGFRIDDGAARPG